MCGDSSSQLPPETELLLEVARNQVFSERSDAVLSLGNRNIEWDALLSTARRHRMRPILHRRLERASSDGVPDPVLTALADAADETVRRNLYMANELTEVLDHLAEYGIRALTYKGPSLAVLAYDDLTLREFADLDVLVPEEDFSDAVDLLRGVGYHLEESFSDVGQKILRKRDGSLSVDLHASITPTRYSFTFPFDRLWEQRIQTNLTKARRVRTVHPSYTLPILATHGAKHYWMRLEWLVSLAALVEREAIDLPSVLRRSERIGCNRMLLLGLQLSRELLGLSLPTEISRAIANEYLIRRMSETIIERVLCRGVGYTDEERTFHRGRHMLELLLMPGLRAKGEYSLRMGRSLLQPRTGLLGE